MPSDQLIYINTISRLSGVRNIHLAYLTKLHLFPQTIRRKINGEITGCYPEHVLDALQEIENLKSRGLTYSQIKYELHKDDRNLSSNFNLQSSIVYLTIGLILGYLIATISTINKTQTQTVAAVPQNTRLEVPAKTQNDPVYVIAVPQNYLYKLGTVDLKL